MRGILYVIRFVCMLTAIAFENLRSLSMMQRRNILAFRRLFYNIVLTYISRSFFTSGQINVYFTELYCCFIAVFFCREWLS